MKVLPHTSSSQEVTESNELILMYRFYYHMTLERYNVCTCTCTMMVEDLRG